MVGYYVLSVQEVIASGGTTIVGVNALPPRIPAQSTSTARAASLIVGPMYSVLSAVCGRLKPGTCGTATPATAAESLHASTPRNDPDAPFLETPVIAVHPARTSRDAGSHKAY